MMRWRTGTWVFLGIAAFAFVIRVVNLGTNPPSLSWDEASIGYNAYSILKTGKDEHGVFMPAAAFTAFGDYKPPIPIYLTVPFVAAFGLSEVAVRLPSAIAGTLTVVAMYFLVLNLFKNSKHEARNPRQIQNPKSQNFKQPFISDFGFDLSFCEAIALFSALVLAITPWHIMLSRAGFEANIALLFVTLGVWWVTASRHNPSWLLVCWLPFVAGVYTFNSARYAGPLLALGVFLYIQKHVWKSKKQFLIGVSIAAITLLPIMPHIVSKHARLRFEEVSIFTNLDVVLEANARIQWDGNAWWAKILDNRRLGYAQSYLVHFLDNVEPRFLFSSGDGNPKFSTQDTGQLLLVSAPFLLYGLLRLFTDKPTLFWFLVWWLAASIAPAAVARETPHALRIENGLPVYMIVTAYGIVSSIIYRTSRKKRVITAVAVLALFVGNFVYFWHNYAVHYPTEYSGEWQYGYKQAIQYVDSVKETYDTVVLTESIGRPYIYVLFYDRISPREFWKTKDASFDEAGFYNVYGLGAYRFVREGRKEYAGRTLYVLPPKDVPEDAHILRTISVLNGTPVLVIFD